LVVATAHLSQGIAPFFYGSLGFCPDIDAGGRFGYGLIWLALLGVAGLVAVAVMLPLAIKGWRPLLVGFAITLAGAVLVESTYLVGAATQLVQASC
jgi:hypothetical protein